MNTRRIMDIAQRAGCMDSNYISSDSIEKFAHMILDECFDVAERLYEYVECEGVPPGYDKSSYLLACNDVIGDIEDHFGIVE